MLSHVGTSAGFEPGCSLRKQPTFLRHHYLFPREVTPEERVPKFHSDDVSLAKSWVVLLIGRTAREFRWKQLEALPRSG